MRLVDTDLFGWCGFAQDGCKLESKPASGLVRCAEGAIDEFLQVEGHTQISSQGSDLQGSMAIFAKIK